MALENYLEKYHKHFPQQHSLITAIHAQELHQTLTNIDISMDNGADGVFLVDHEFNPNEFIKIAEKARRMFPTTWIGVNILSKFPIGNFEAIAGMGIDGVRVDDPQIKEVTGINKADEINETIIKTAFQGLYFGGVAFKHQPFPQDLELACEVSKRYMDVITTSGAGTGISADDKHVQSMRQICGDFPLALASGVSIENIEKYPGVNAFIVATAISRDFHNLQSIKVMQITDIIAKMNKKS